MKKSLKLLGIGVISVLALNKVSAVEQCDGICTNITLTPSATVCYKEDDPIFVGKKPLIQYIVKDDSIELCDNPDLKLRTEVEACELEGWYLDKELTQKVTGDTIGDVIKPVEFKTDANGCVTQFNYITNVYAKCKEKIECPTDMNLVKELMYNNDGVITKVTVNGTQNLLTPVKEGYTFDGWYYDDKFTKKVEGTTTDTFTFESVYDENNCLTAYKPITVYAKWLKIPEICTDEVNTNVNLTYVIDETETKKVTVSTLKDELLYVPNKEGYNFDGWFYDDKFTNEVSDLTFVQKYDEKDCLVGYEDITVYAKWEKIEKQETPVVKNPDTGDNIVLYVGAGAILLAACAIVMKKLANK